MKASEKLKNEIKEATASRLKMYKNDFQLQMDSDAVIDMESKYIVGILEIGLEFLNKEG